ncbi:50S ribosomal protein L11 methyltransferase [uncultured Oscillibacter sp.]|uniref:50S ribosomal protein L11 methyltransferase n=1 Tax=uncultured Oscillibacter sp. TaxID=876091 RepID=UPI002610BD11|nr:50S ribosomal protein L11 methyltransferase [uncultured Oscillibacter sp.]
MRWLEVHIDTNHAGLDTVQAMLSGLDVDGVMIEDEEEFQDFLENNHDYWDYVDEDLERHMAGRSRITFYLEAQEAGFAKLGEVRVALEGLKQERRDLGTLLMTLEDVEDADWENNWKQYYKPMEIGERLLVIPQWEEADPGDRVPLYLDPGLTFGTGAHATTRLCLTALETLVRGGERVLDLGCGSGILSVAALRLGAGSALAVDIDDKCRTAARENAGLNGIGPDRLDILVGNLLTDEAAAEKIGGGYDLVLANIVADVIIALAPRVRGLLSPGGTFLCSGIIEGRADEAAAALNAAGLEIRERREDNGWYAFTCQ